MTPITPTPAPKIRRAGALSIAMKLVMLALVMPRVLRFKLGRNP